MVFGEHGEVLDEVVGGDVEVATVALWVDRRQSSPRWTMVPLALFGWTAAKAAAVSA